MGPFLWAWHPISTAALVQCPPIAGNDNYRTANTNKTANAARLGKDPNLAEVEFQLDFIRACC